MRTLEIAPRDLTSRTYYHATSLWNAHKIADEGFRVWFEGKDEQATNGTLLGSGIYVSSQWRTAWYFGDELLRVGILPGTRLLNAAVPPEERVLEYLVREFGHEVLTKPPRKVIPTNKNLTQRELISLVRYHFQRAFTGIWWKGGNALRRTEMHRTVLARLRSDLIAVGFDGYGHPTNDLGIVLFDGGLVELRERVASVPRQLRYRFMTAPDAEGNEIFRAFFDRCGGRAAERFAELVTLG